MQRPRPPGTACRPHQAVALFLLVAAVIPIGDVVIVLRNGGSKVLAYAMHGGTALAMAVVGVLILV
ncbi:MAG TPA: DUF4267 domain-containing protein [Pseudonocardiaceae bacterium]